MKRYHDARAVRQVAVLGAVAALAGGTAASGAQAAATDSTQRAVQIRPGTLDRGPHVGVPHTHRRAIHAGDRMIRTGLARRPTLVGRARHGFVVRTIAPRRGTTRLWTIHPNGSKTFIARLPGSWQNMEVSTDGTRVAYSWSVRRDVKVAVRLTGSGRRLHTATFGSRLAELEGYGKRRLLMSRQRPRPAATFWYAPATENRQRIARKDTWAVDVRRNRIALAIRVDQGGYDGYCIRYAKLSTPRQQQWYSCKQKPVAWSGRSGKVLTTHIAADGLGSSALQVRRAGGKLVRTLRTDLFGSARFVGKSRIMVAAQGRHKAALVRCTVRGRCNRATGLRPASELGPNHALKLSLLP